MQVSADKPRPDVALAGTVSGGLPRVRKLVTHVDDLVQEAGTAVPGTLRRVVAAAVVPNPWAGRWVDDLSAEVEAIHAVVAPALIQRLIRHAGGSEAIEAFGKGVIVGLDGEMEHGAALIHNPHLGDRFRVAIGGTSIIAFSEQRAEPGRPLSVPMWHVRQAATRSHYQAVELYVPDAPAPDEIVVALAVSTGPRPFARIGDRTTD